MEGAARWSPRSAPGSRAENDDAVWATVPAPCAARDPWDDQGDVFGACLRCHGRVGLWGFAHAIPTRRVLAGFDPVTRDNRRVILQEWLAEAFAMWGIAAVLSVVTAIGGSEAAVSSWAYRATAGLLVALAVLTALTGARTPVLWFKICPFVGRAAARREFVVASGAV
jgi:hypothetical protein